MGIPDYTQPAAPAAAENIDDLELDADVARELGIELPNEPVGGTPPTPGAAPAAPAAPAAATPAPASQPGNATVPLSVLNEALRALGYEQPITSADDVVHIVRSARSKMYDAVENETRTRRELRLLQNGGNPPGPQGSGFPRAVPGYVDPNADPNDPVLASVHDLGRRVVASEARETARMREEAAAKFDGDMASLKTDYPWMTETMQREVALEAADTGNYDVGAIFFNRYRADIRANERKAGAQDLAMRLKRGATAAAAVPASRPSGVAAVVDPRALSPEDQARWLDAEIDRCFADPAYAAQQSREAADRASIY